MEYTKKNKKSKAKQKTTRIRLKNKQSPWACTEVWGAIGTEEGRLVHLSMAVGYMVAFSSAAHAPIITRGVSPVASTLGSCFSILIQ